tara:strand:- start:4277 stop:4576 length:300 start_codon:yes stop_codon:yes gene_type:complete
MKYSNTSLYGTTPIRNSILDVLDYREIPAVSEDVLYEIKAQYNYRPDLLASDLYDDPNLWWVFKSRNPSVLDDPVFDFVAGTNIYVPNIETIKTVLGNY